jgi:hypothetical protein
VLFDLGLGTLQVDVCVRSADPELTARLRAGAGRSIFEADNPAMPAILAGNPHRVFICRFGRAEVYQPIPPADGRSPDGPHTHLLPKLLRSGQTHAATEPVPSGWVPCAHIYPAHPVKDAMGHFGPFDPARHSAFQSLLRTFGDPNLTSVKDRVLTALRNGDDPSSIVIPDSRHARSAVRVALRQVRAAGETSPVVAVWAKLHDRPQDPEIESEPLHPER